MTLARVSILLPAQNGHMSGRATFSANGESGMVLFPRPEGKEPRMDAQGASVCMIHVGCFMAVRLLKSEQPYEFSRGGYQRTWNDEI